MICEGCGVPGGCVCIIVGGSWAARNINTCGLCLPVPGLWHLRFEGNSCAKVVGQMGQMGQKLPSCILAHLRALGSKWAKWAKWASVCIIVGMWVFSSICSPQHLAPSDVPSFPSDRKYRMAVAQPTTNRDSHFQSSLSISSRFLEEAQSMRSGPRAQ